MFGIMKRGQTGFVMAAIITLIIGVIGAVIIGSLTYGSATWNATMTGINGTVGGYVLTFFILGLLALAASVSMRALNG